MAGTTPKGLQLLDASQAQPEVLINLNSEKIDTLLDELGGSITVEQFGDSPGFSGTKKIVFYGATVEHETGGVVHVIIEEESGHSDSGGAGASLEVNGTAGVTQLDFSGAQVHVTDVGGGVVTVEIDAVSGASGAGYDFFGSVNFVPPPLAASGWTWQNQEADVVTDIVGGGLKFASGPHTGSGSGGYFERALASGTFTLTACLQIAMCPNGAFPGYGIYWRDSSTGHIQELQIDLRTTPGFSSYRWSAYTAFASSNFSAVRPLQTWPALVWFPLWLRVVRDVSGNIDCFYSMEGENWIHCAAQDVTNYVAAPDRVGVVFRNDAAGSLASDNTNYVKVFSWEVT